MSADAMTRDVGPWLHSICSIWPCCIRQVVVPKSARSACQSGFSSPCSEIWAGFGAQRCITLGGVLHVAPMIYCMAHDQVQGTSVGGFEVPRAG